MQPTLIAYIEMSGKSETNSGIIACFNLKSKEVEIVFTH